MYIHDHTMIYFDNNATTMMSSETIREMIKWCNKGNPSSSYAAAVASRKMMTDLRDEIGRMSGINTCCEEPRDNRGEHITTSTDTFTVVFTSGASESNSSVIACIAAAYRANTRAVPHFVVSAVEHKSIILAVDALVSRGEATVEYLTPDASGHISPWSVRVALTARPDTALVCIMHANNESGAINDVRAISAECVAMGVPFHCDVVQTWGRHPDTQLLDWCDSWSVSFHKVCGPPGVGVWCVRTALIDAYGIGALVHGTQNGGLRGGTENIPGLGASLAAIRTLDYTPARRVHIRTLRGRLMGLIERAFNTMLFVDYVEMHPTKRWRGIVWISGDSADTTYLGGTILLSVVRPPDEPAVCNTEMKNALADVGIIVSVGSACNTSNKKASHVLYAMGCDEVIRRGTLRISLGCQNTTDEVDTFVARFITIARGQILKK